MRENALRLYLMVLPTQQEQGSAGKPLEKCGCHPQGRAGVPQSVTLGSPRNRKKGRYTVPLKSTEGPDYFFLGAENKSRTPLVGTEVEAASQSYGTRFCQ